MLYPTIKKLLDTGENRYNLVIMASKRARQILDGSEVLVESKSTKAVTKAVEEIAAGKVYMVDPEEDKADDVIA